MSEIQLLQDPLTFPDFSSCPGEDFIDMVYYGTADGTYFKPSRHWCLFAEIIDACRLIRLRLTVRDKSGNIFPVAFHPEGAEMPALEKYKIGFTIAILYPHQHHFLDMSTGIRQEYMENIQVIFRTSKRILLTLQIIPLGLADVMKVVEDFGVRPTCCQVCKVPQNSPSKCARCGLGWYCSKVRFQNPKPILSS